jgi:hypothetical protein
MAEYLFFSLEDKDMSFVNLVIKIFRTPSRQEITPTSQPVSVERDGAPEFKGYTRQDRDRSPRHDQVDQMLAITWMGWRNV